MNLTNFYVIALILSFGLPLMIAKSAENVHNRHDFKVKITQHLNTSQKSVNCFAETRIEHNISLTYENAFVDNNPSVVRYGDIFVEHFSLSDFNEIDVK